MDFAVEDVDIGEGLVSQMMRREVVPDNLDVVELGSVLGQPLDGEPVLALAECRPEILLAWIGLLSKASTTVVVARPGLGP